MPETPELATCSYGAYRRGMGAAVRITLGMPRFIRLPDPRFSDRERLPYLSELAPRKDYFRAAPDEFDRRYLAQLDRLAVQIEEMLTEVPAEDGRLVLLCFERKVRGPQDCHRRLFAEWWTKRTGQKVPELDGAESDREEKSEVPIDPGDVST